nr:uncharacterized protein LOC111996747 [Quercus suber]
MPGVDPEFIVLRLNVDSSFPPKKQKPRRSAREHVEAVKAEVQRLKEAGAIREIYFLEWLANTVVVKKKSGKLRVCVDFTDLNRACPKNPFPMPKINQLQHKLRLNAEKCAFGVGAGKFLEYLITNQGIEVNPDQIEAVKRLKLPSNLKEVQMLTGMLAALNQFISKFVDCCRPFYQLLKKWKGFQWNQECDRAF